MVFGRKRAHLPACCGLCKSNTRLPLKRYKGYQNIKRAGNFPALFILLCRLRVVGPQLIEERPELRKILGTDYNLRII